MNPRMYFLICGIVFLVVAVAHLARLIAGCEVVVSGWAVPRWISFPGLIVSGFLSAWGFVLALRSGQRA